MERRRLSPPPRLPADPKRVPLRRAHAPTKAMKRRAKKEAEETRAPPSAARPGDGAFRGPAERSSEASTSPNSRRQLSVAGLRVREIRADGHCMYRAVIDQLATRAPDQHAELELSIDPTNDSDDLASIGKIRARVRGGVGRDAARRTLPTPLPSPPSDGPPPGDWDAYLETVRSVQKAARGGQLEPRNALARALKRPIEVFTADMPTVTMRAARTRRGRAAAAAAAAEVEPR